MLHLSNSRVGGLALMHPRSCQSNIVSVKLQHFPEMKATHKYINVRTFLYFPRILGRILTLGGDTAHPKHIISSFTHHKQR